MSTSQVAGPKVAALRVRPFKGSKKRPIFMRRPSLKEVNARMRDLNRQRRQLRGALRRTSESDKQLQINQQIVRVKQAQEGVARYVDNLTRKD